MLKELPWSMCPDCEQSGYIDGEGCLRCGWQDWIADIAGSVIGKGQVMQVTGGLPKTRNSNIGFADVDVNPISFYVPNNGYSFYEMDHILRLELGESFTTKTWSTFAGCYEIMSWIKVSNEDKSLIKLVVEQRT